MPPCLRRRLCRGRQVFTPRQLDTAHRPVYLDFVSCSEIAVERIVIPVAAGIRLEGALRRVPGAAVAAIIAHAYPLFGGDMNGSVVLAIEDALQASGLTTLRFNFRGTGASSGNFDRGRGEQDDVRAAAAFLTGEGMARQVVLAGYSFGAIVTLHAAPAVPEAIAVIAVVPPLSRMPFANRPALVPELFLVAAHDPYCTPEDARHFCCDRPRRTLVTIVAAGHELTGCLAEAQRRITSFVSDVLAGVPPSCPG